MSIYPYLEHKPKVGKDCFIAESAAVAGKVTMGDNVSVWFNSVVRADINQIFISKNSNKNLCNDLHVSLKIKNINWPVIRSG